MMNYFKLSTRLASAVIAVSFFAPISALSAQNNAGAPKPLTGDQKIIHVLNRLGYGARPGDIEKVRTLGIQKYIERQLDPSSIDDTVALKKVNGLDTASMSTSELFAKYPDPGALLRQIEGRGRQMPPAPAMPGATTSAAPEISERNRRENRQKINELYRKHGLRPAAQLMPQIVANRALRAVYSERQLQEVMVDFWQNHFNVYSGKAALRWFIPSYERDVLRRHALGNFKDLLTGTAQHPAMLFYLDNFESAAPNAPAGANANQQRIQRMIRDGRPLPAQARERLKRQLRMNDEQLDNRLKEMRGGQEIQVGPQQRQRGINENYARELMELHTLGVDGGYSQKDIIEVARAFTGWTIADPRGYRRAAAAMINGTEDQRIRRMQRQQGVPDDIESGEFLFNPRWHDKDPKIVLGHKIDVGGHKDGLKVIDLLAAHPSTAKHIARKLAVRFVSDTPSEGLVSRVAKAFNDSSGDIRVTLRTLFNDKEFFAPENYRAKIKSPFEVAVSSIRVLGGDTDAGPAFMAMLRKLGEVPYGYQAPTGYPDTAADWVNTGALLERLNFAVAIASNRIPGSRVNVASFSAAKRGDVLYKAVSSVLHGEISAATLSNLKKQLDQPLPDVKIEAETDEDEIEMLTMRRPQQGGGRQARLLPPSGDPEIFKIVSLVLGSPEFQRQ